MATSSPQADPQIVPGGIFQLDLDGLSTVMFTDISGLRHSVGISGSPVGTATGGSADSRVVVSAPDPLTLQMSHVVMSDLSLFTWMDETAAALGAVTTAKSGTLMLVTLQTMQTVKSWRLAEVYITSLALGAMGAQSGPYLTALVSLLVGTCVPI